LLLDLSDRSHNIIYIGLIIIIIIISLDVKLDRPPAIVESYTFLSIHEMDQPHFMNLIRQSPIMTSPPSDVDNYASRLEADVTAALDQLAPLKHRTRRFGQKSSARWMTEYAREKK
jgi:hypothetical protein